jgi:membrane protease YdiL (CAAX protease family)
VLVSSGLFGLWHVGTGQPENWVVVCLAAMFGVGLAAMRLGCGTIWPGVVWHWAYNLLLHVGPDGAAGAPILFGPEPAAQAFGRLAPALLMLAYGLVALRPRRFGPGALAVPGAMGRRAAVREREPRR